MIVTSQRTTVQTMTKAVPATGAWPWMANPMESRRRAEPRRPPPSTSVPSVSGKVRSRLATNFRLTGTS
jgi:hypothetical protein